MQALFLYPTAGSFAVGLPFAGSILPLRGHRCGIVRLRQHRGNPGPERIMRALSFLAALLATACGAAKAPASLHEQQIPAAMFVVPSQVEGEYSYAWISRARDNEEVVPKGRLRAYVDGQPIGDIEVAGHIPNDNTAGCTEPPRLTLTGDLAGIGEHGAVLANIDVNANSRLLPRTVSDQVLTALRQALADSPGAGAQSRHRLARMMAHGEGVHVFADDTGREIALLASSSTDTSGELLSSLLAVVGREREAPWQTRLLDFQTACADCDSMPTHYTFRAAGDFNGDGTPEFLLEGIAYEQWNYVLVEQASGRWTIRSIGGGGGC
ncbi:MULTISPECIES: hypothetical protein [unclassified Luteimonas]